MRFKRPQVRYRHAAACHSVSSRRVWDDRIGSSRVQAKNWRFMAFGCLLLALLMAGGLVWRSAQSIVTPYVIEVDQAGQVRTVGEPPRSTGPPMRRSLSIWRISSRWFARCPSTRSWCGRGSMPMTTPTRARPCSTTTPTTMTRSPASAASR